MKRLSQYGDEWLVVIFIRYSLTIYEMMEFSAGIDQGQNLLLNLGIM